MPPSITELCAQLLAEAPQGILVLFLRHSRAARCHLAIREVAPLQFFGIAQTAAQRGARALVHGFREPGHNFAQKEVDQAGLSSDFGCHERARMEAAARNTSRAIAVVERQGENTVAQLGVAVCLEAPPYTPTAPLFWIRDVFAERFNAGERRYT